MKFLFLLAVALIFSFCPCYAKEIRIFKNWIIICLDCDHLSWLIKKKILNVNDVITALFEEFSFGKGESIKTYEFAVNSTRSDYFKFDLAKGQTIAKCLHEKLADQDKDKLIKTFEKFYNEIYVISPYMTINLLKMTVEISNTVDQQRLLGIVNENIGERKEAETHYKECISISKNERCISELLSFYYKTLQYKEMEEYSTQLITTESEVINKEEINYYLLLSKINSNENIKTIIESLTKYCENYSNFKYISPILDNIIMKYGTNEWEDMIIAMIEKRPEDLCFKIKLENYFPSILLDDKTIEFFKNKIINQLHSYINNSIVINGIDNCPLDFFNKINHKDPQFNEIFNLTSEFILLNPTISNIVNEHAQVFTNIELNQRIVKVGFIYQDYDEDRIIESEGFQYFADNLPFEKVERINLFLENGKRVIEEPFFKQQTYSIQGNNVQNVVNSLAQLKLDIVIYENPYCSFLQYCMIHNKVAHVQLLFTDYYPHITSPYIDYIITANRNFKTIQNIQAKHRKAQIVETDSLGLYYPVPWPPTPKIKSENYHFNKNDLIISIGYNPRGYKEQFLSIIKRLINEFKNVKIMILLSMNEDRNQFELVKHLFITYFNDNNNNNNNNIVPNRIRFLPYKNRVHLLSILSFVQLNLDGIDGYYDIMYYSYSSLLQIPTVVFRNDNIYSVDSETMEMMGYKELIVKDTNEYYTKIKELINNKTLISYYHDDLHINRYIIFNDTSLGEEILPFFTLSMIRAFTPNKTESLNFVNTLKDNYRFDTCTTQSFLFSEYIPTNDYIVESIGECFAFLREYTSSYRKYKLRQFINPKPLSEDSKYHTIYKKMNDTYEIDGWVQWYYQEIWEFQPFR